jgi:LuxR family maltose regulon positive regulatory protein
LPIAAPCNGRRLRVRAKANGTHALLRTKVLPPSSARQLIERPRLRIRAHDIADVRLALVRAPAGFGKTSLLSQWYHELAARGRRAGWLSFDHNDQDPLEVLAYLVLALETAGHVFDAPVACLLGPDGLASPDAAVNAVVNDLCRARQPIFLFLDDLHVLRGTPVERVLRSLIDRAPDTLHVVMASREFPDMPLARARALGELLEITDRELRFSKAETAQFMASAGYGSLTDFDLQTLDGRVEGWVAGLKLAAIALDSDARHAELFETISGRRWTFAEFFGEVVLGRQSPELRDFLLQTSLLDRFCPELCEAMTGASGARDRLDEIESRGLFLFSLDGERTWHRYHHLFAEFLREELSRRYPDRARELHARAGRWFAASDLHGEAFSHAIEARDFALAADVLDRRCHTMFYSGQLRVLLDQAAQIPEPVLAGYPRILLAKAWSLILEWKFAEARAILETVAPAREPMLYLHCTMMLAQFEDDMPQVERQCGLLLDRFMDADPYLVGTYYTSLLYAEREQFKLRNLERFDARARDYYRRAGSRFVIVWHQSIAGPTKFLAGDSGGAIEALEEALEAATTVSGRHSPLASIPALLLAEVHYERDELDAARTLLNDHLERASELGFVDQLVAGYITQSRLCRLQGDALGAERVLSHAMELAHGRSFRRLELNLVAEHAVVLLRDGELVRAVRLAAAHGVPASAEAVLPKPGTTTRVEAVAVAWVSIAQAAGQSSEALRVAKRWLRFADQAGAVRSAIRWGTIVAQILLLAGDARGARRVAWRAVEAAAPGRFVRSFVDLGGLLPALLGDAVAPEGEGAHRAGAFAAELLARCAVAPPPLRNDADAVRTEAPTLGEALNPRELEILRLVASGMSNRGIADRLAMTEGTVKWHLHRVFDKLGARRRTQAVQRVRQIGLIG